MAYCAPQKASLQGAVGSFTIGSPDAASAEPCLVDVDDGSEIAKKDRKIDAMPLVPGVAKSIFPHHRICAAQRPTGLPGWLLALFDELAERRNVRWTRWCGRLTNPSSAVCGARSPRTSPLGIARPRSFSHSWSRPEDLTLRFHNLAYVLTDGAHGRVVLAVLVHQQPEAARE